MSALGVRREKAALSSGCETHRHRLRHLFHEEGNPVSALHDFDHHVRREPLIADNVRDDGGCLALPKSVEYQAGHMGPSHP